ncbi:D-beta-hydroxybutyrate dehydrogenase, mitochondrial-like [Gigantopelta aegis]|uniref:D-beta-hydroxybutyrate dehydrogenase, mitochondrial-like n=1 Tax=Gigantopelta aegis TaxID=1735272 RepID=UPI001B88C87F|nr:D-beta-hydroxybutyrate dehydrogenase, mitochondrial-like [Gigantopelta aegis]XP_041364988.1 D-beta-hydroxybutyrate dehydrogenase, mitochondrial-like [Gigantopelta aegis]
MKITEFIGLQIFEFLYLLLLAFLPFVVLQRSVSFVILALIGLWVVYYSYKKLTTKAVEALGKTVLITGCDSGFGHALAKRLDAVGFTVFAGCLSKESDGATLLQNTSDRIHTLELDITKDESIRECLETVQEHCGSKGLWALVNNAAINYIGDVEFSSMDAYRRVGEVNLYGTINMTKQFIPLVRTAKGRIVIVTSAQGRLAVPSNSTYAITKYGLECFSDILRLELQGFGVKVVVVEPGNFGGSTGMLSPLALSRMEEEFSNMWKHAHDDVRTSYGKDYLDSQYKSVIQAAATAGPNIVPVIDAMEDAVSSVSPSIRYLVDGDKSWYDHSNFLIRIRPFIPDKVLDYLVKRVSVNTRPKPALATY